MSKTYHKIIEGSGDIITFPNTKDVNGGECLTVGTSDLHSCVGVYVPLSQNRCFAAHIFAYIADTGDDTEIGYARYSIPLEKEGPLLVDKIREVLEQNLRPHLPFDQDAIYELTDKAHVVCPNLELKDWTGRKRTAVGSFVIGGLQSFFDTTFPVENGVGFIKTYGSEDVEILEEGEIHGWESCTVGNGCPRPARNWTLVFKDGKWQLEDELERKWSGS